MVDPAEQLGRAEALLAQLLAERSQAFPVEVEQVDHAHGPRRPRAVTAAQRE